MNKSAPVVSDTELNSLSTAVPNTVSACALKYLIIIYAFGLAHEKFSVKQSRCKAVPESKFPAKPGEKNS